MALKRWGWNREQWGGAQMKCPVFAQAQVNHFWKMMGCPGSFLQETLLATVLTLIPQLMDCHLVNLLVSCPSVVPLNGALAPCAALTNIQTLPWR